MPTPHGSRGGMAFSADELRVLRRALAEALHHSPFPPVRRPAVPAPAGEPVGAAEYLRLTEALDEAVREGARLRAFLAADRGARRHRFPAARVRAAGGPEPLPGPAPEPPPGPRPDRRVPTPAELWPPRRREPPAGPRPPAA